MRSSTSTLKFNLPTVLTLSRIVVIPLFILVTPGNNFLGAVIFGLASITDFLDGYLARRKGEITKFGIIVDPIADKFLVIAALILLVDMGRISVWIAIIVIVREFLVTALRVVALSKDIIIRAEMGGKLKVGAQITAILCLILAGSALDTFFIVVLVNVIFHLTVIFLLQKRFKKVLLKLIAIVAYIFALELLRESYFFRMDELYDAGTVIIWISIVLSIISGIQYMLSFWRTITSTGEGGT
jgi:CDP-diacylglycerol--glycerol-3-phosphate 3-phosphatidyltransferase